MATAAALSAKARSLLSAATAAAERTPFLKPHLRRLVRAGRLADIDAAFAALLPTHPVAALSALSSVGLHDRASALLATMPSPAAAHLNAVLRPLLGRRRLARLVPSILDAHPSVPRDAATDSILARSICLTSGADAALHLLHSPPSGAAAGPSVQLFTALIDSYYKQGRPDRAEMLWDAMVNDRGIAPDAAAYNVLIAYEAANGTYEEVRELMRDMRKLDRLQPDIVTYNSLMQAMARHGMVDKLMEVYKRLEEGEDHAVAPVPDCATYTCVVRALCGTGRWHEAEAVFYAGVKRGKVTDLATVHRLVSGLRGTGCSDDDDAWSGSEDWTSDWTDGDSDDETVGTTSYDDY